MASLLTPPPSPSTTTFHPQLAAAALHAHLLRLNDPQLPHRVLPLYTETLQLRPARSLPRLTPHKALTHFHYNTLIRAHTDSSLHEDTVSLFVEMRSIGLDANEFTYPFVLKSCSALGYVGMAVQIHSEIIKNGLMTANVFSTTALLDVYAKWGTLGDACKLFDRIPERNVVAWNAVISACAQTGFYQEALEMVDCAIKEVKADNGVSSWNAVIAGCVRRMDVNSALEMFGMMLESMKPNPATFNTLLPMIPEVGSAHLLKELHCYALRHMQVVGMGAIDEERLLSAIASGYALNGLMEYASPMFDEVRSKNCQLWNSIISGFVGVGKIHEAFEFFRVMARIYTQELRTLSKVSLTLVLPECSPLLKTGLEIHGYAYRHGLDAYSSVSNALIAMYRKRCEVGKCERVFERAMEKDVVTWNTMVSTYAVDADYRQAFGLFGRMLSEGVRPDEFSFGSVLNGCGYSSSLLQGRGVHGQIIKGGFCSSSNVVQNAIMDMYGKCGCVDDASRIFNGIELKDHVSWNTIISCYAFNGCPNEAFLLFEKMKEVGWRPNRVTFIALLSACSHAGLVDEGLRYLQSMSKEHGIVPDVDHYACIVDNLSRAGQLDCAFQLIQEMPVEPDDCVWGALLGGCRIHGNIPLAEISARHLLEIEPGHSGYRVLLSNVYADASQWRNVDEVWSAMRDDRIKKMPGYSWIELGSVVHKFFTADKSHERCDGIYSTLDVLTMQLRDEGYIPYRNARFRSSYQEKVELESLDARWARKRSHGFAPE